MTLPSKDSFETLGGRKQDSIEEVDPQTDLTAAASNTARADTAAMTRTAILARCTFTGSATYPAVTYHDAVWGNSVSYIPSASRVSQGVYTLTWPATITDFEGNAQSVNFFGGWSNVRYTSAANANVTAVAANVVTVCTFEGTSSSDVAAQSVDIYMVG